MIRIENVCFFLVLTRTDSAIHINSMTVHDEWTLPHGGAKSSGFGRFNGQWGIEEFVRMKTITYKE